MNKINIFIILLLSYFIILGLFDLKSGLSNFSGYQVNKSNLLIKKLFYK
jgi:hypothetical protein